MKAFFRPWVIGLTISTFLGMSVSLLANPLTRETEEIPVFTTNIAKQTQSGKWVRFLTETPISGVLKKASLEQDVLFLVIDYELTKKENTNWQREMVSLIQESFTTFSHINEVRFVVRLSDHHKWLQVNRQQWKNASKRGEWNERWIQQNVSEKSVD